MSAIPAGFFLHLYLEIWYRVFTEVSTCLWLCFNHETVPPNMRFDAVFVVIMLGLKSSKLKTAIYCTWN